MAVSHALVELPTILKPLGHRSKVLPFPLQWEASWLQYRYETIWERGQLVGATIPWLTTPESGIIHNGQVWHVENDGKHAKPFSEEEQIRFMHDMNSPIIVIGWIGSMALSLFLKEILERRAAYVRG